MKVIKSKTLGYCHGVASTLKKAQYCIDRAKECNKKAYSIGNLIHNSDVVKTFSEQGLTVIADSLNPKGIALVRAHGIADSVRADFISKGFELVDATCINILHTKKVIKEDFNQGRKIVLLGVKSHAETECLMGTDKSKCILVSCDSDLKKLFETVAADEKITLVTQTTFPQSMYEKYSAEISEHYKDCKTGNNLCPNCIQRKKDGLELAGQVDAIVVVGGKNSENTKDLAAYIGNSKKPVFLIENVRDFNKEIDDEFRRFDKIGVCSGTSTPMEIIDKVCDYINSL